MENITTVALGMTGSQLITALNNNYEAIGDNSRTHGANIANFLKKAIDYKDGQFGATVPNVVIIGDSITNDMYEWTWSRTLKSLLHTNYGIPEANINIHCRGGYSMDMYLPWLEDVLIYPNPDLIVFSEFEGAGTAGNNEYYIMIERFIQLIRERTSADIVISTWGAADLTTIWNDGTPLAWSQIMLLGGWTSFNWYRNLAVKYHCELVDLNRALIDAVVGGTDPSTIYSNAPHMGEVGYAICNVEMAKHFKDTSWIARYSYANNNVSEDLIPLASILSLNSFKNIHKNISFGNVANWTFDHTTQQARCSTNGDSLIVDFTGIGIELFYAASNAGHDIELSEDDGSTWINPSAYRTVGKPLQYATEVNSITHASNADQWVLKRPIMHVEVLDNILANGVRMSGQYKIKITATTPNIKYNVIDPNGNVLGEITVGTDATIGNLKFNSQWNGVNNYLLVQTPAINDEFGFYIKSNWQDSVNTSVAGSVRIQGLENKPYKIRFVKTDTTQSKLRFIKIMKAV